MMERIYNFTQEQIKVLLSGSGYTKLAGLNIATSALNNEQALKALNELSKAGFIESDNDGFEATEDIRKIIMCLGTSYAYMVMHTNSMNLPDKCLFFADKLLVCTSRNSDKKHISAQFIDYADLCDSLFDEGYLPLTESDFVIYDSELEQYEEEIFSSIVPNEPLAVSSSVIFNLDELSIDEKLLRYLRVVDYYFYTYIVYFDGKEVVRELYSPDSFRVYLGKMINI